MENALVKGICQIGIFMICAQTFVHFCPKGAYEKYLKMLVSIMVLIQIISPIGKVLGGNQQGIVNIQKGDWLEEILMQSMDDMLREKKIELGEGETIEGMETIEATEKLGGMEGRDGIEPSETYTKEGTPERKVGIYIEPVAPIHVGQ